MCGPAVARAFALKGAGLTGCPPHAVHAAHAVRITAPGGDPGAAVGRVSLRRVCRTRRVRHVRRSRVRGRPRVIRCGTWCCRAVGLPAPRSIRADLPRGPTLPIDALPGVRGVAQVVGVGPVRIHDPTDAPAGPVADHGAPCADRGQAPQASRCRPDHALHAHPPRHVGPPPPGGRHTGDEEGDDGGIAVPRRRVGGHSQVTQGNGCAELDDGPDHCDDGRQDEQIAGTPAQDGQGQGEPGGVVAQNDAHRRAEQCQARAHGQQ